MTSLLRMPRDLLQRSPFAGPAAVVRDRSWSQLERSFYFLFFNAPGPWRRIQARASYDALSGALSFALPKGAGAELDELTVSSGFLNYGYEDEDHAAFVEGLEEQQRARAYSVRLYHRVLAEVGAEGSDILEVGCGRGGGCDVAMRTFSPRSVIGIDLSERAIDFCNATHRVDGLDFRVGDAEQIPFAEESFDVVINVESSHCYPSMERFLAEVSRVLRPGGRFSWVDARPRGNVERTEAEFARSGLELVRSVDITPHVVRALDSASDTKIEYVRETVPPPLRPLARHGMAVRGTMMYEALARGELVYLSKALRKA